MKTFNEFKEELNKDTSNGDQEANLKSFLGRVKPIFKSNRFFYAAAVFTQIKVIDNTLTFQMKTLTNIHREPFVTGYGPDGQIEEKVLFKKAMEKAVPPKGKWYVWVQKSLVKGYDGKVGSGGGTMHFTISQDLHPKQDPRDNKLGTPMFTLEN